MVEIIVIAERELYSDQEWEELLDDSSTIVRCEDCTHYEEREERMYGICKRMEHMWHFTSFDDFCSRGEMRQS